MDRREQDFVELAQRWGNLPASRRREIRRIARRDARAALWGILLASASLVALAQFVLQLAH